MKVPRFWAKAIKLAESPEGRQYKFACWGWSESSADEAQQRAEQRATGFANRASIGEKLWRYAYSDGVLREQIMQVLNDDDGNAIATVTRNSYGALVLNAAQAMFVDVDLPAHASSGGGVLGRLFGKPKPQLTPGQVALARIEQWAASNASLGVRVYHTRGGLRVLVTNHLFDPAASSTQTILAAMGCDPLYVKLCRSQQCFRARLTPKPFRIGVDNPKVRHIASTEAEKNAIATWSADYQTRSAQFGVCELAVQHNRVSAHPSIAPIIALHDQSCRVGSGLALA